MGGVVSGQSGRTGGNGVITATGAIGDTGTGTGAGGTGTDAGGDAPTGARTVTDGGMSAVMDTGKDAVTDTEPAGRGR